MQTDDFLNQFGDILQNIEFAVVQIYREHPELTDVNVDRVYENIQRGYQNEIKGKPAPKANFSALEQQLFQNVRGMCEWRLRRAEYAGVDEDEGQPDKISLDDMVACLKRLRRSLGFWTGKTGGIRGYLNYIKGFIV
jgi:hypothetical protein